MRTKHIIANMNEKISRLDVHTWQSVSLSQSPSHRLRGNAFPPLSPTFIRRLKVGDVEGCLLRVGLAAGEALGDARGDALGEVEGDTLGDVEGDIEGDIEGEFEGCTLGLLLGFLIGLLEGCTLGDILLIAITTSASPYVALETSTVFISSHPASSHCSAFSRRAEMKPPFWTSSSIWDTRSEYNVWLFEDSSTQKSSLHFSSRMTSYFTTTEASLRAVFCLTLTFS